MTRPQLVIRTESTPGGPRPSAKVRTVAAILDAHESDIRRMVDDGTLEAHGKGKRGVRVYLDSVADYQARKARGPRRQAQAAELPKARRRVHLAAHSAAVERLRARGLM